MKNTVNKNLEISQFVHTKRNKNYFFFEEADLQSLSALADEPLFGGDEKRFNLTNYKVNL